MALAATRANKLAQARNAIARRQATAARINAKAAAKREKADRGRDRRKDKRERINTNALNTSIQTMSNTKGGPSLGAFLDKYKEQGGNKPSEAATEFYSTFPGAKRYTAEYTDDQGK